MNTPIDAHRRGSYSIIYPLSFSPVTGETSERRWEYFVPRLQLCRIHPSHERNFHFCVIRG